MYGGERISMRNLSLATAYTAFYEGSGRHTIDGRANFKEAISQIEPRHSNTVFDDAVFVLQRGGRDKSRVFRAEVSLVGSPKICPNGRGTRHFATIEIQPLEKLRSSPQVKPLRLVVSVAGGLGWTDDDVLVRVGGGWVTLASKVDKLADQAKRRLIKAAKEFAGRETENATDAECCIDVEIERRINKKRMEDIQPMPQILEKLAPEIRIQIWRYVMNLSDHVFPYCYTDAAFWPFYLPWDRSPGNVELLRTGGVVTGEALEALYKFPRYTFTLPHRLHNWMGSLSPRNRTMVNKIEIGFEGDVYLRYLQPYLGFFFARHTRFLSEVLDGSLDIDAFLDLIAESPLVNLTVRFPFLHRMFYCGFEHCCYMTLCKWIVKAVMKAVSGREHITVVFESNVGSNNKPNLSADQMDELRRFQQAADGIPWRDLGVEEGEEVHRPPECLCSSA